jgi:prepilin-type N-terminal cleavage/methylation domain-containing protein
MWRASGDRGGPRAARGFSLLELLIAGALFSVVIAGVYLLYTTMQGTLTRGEMKSDLQQNARVGLDRLAQELRMAGYDPENALGQLAVQRFNEIRAAGGDCLSFVTYRTHSGAERTVRVTYSLNGGTLRRREEDWVQAGTTFGVPHTQPVAEAVSQLSFTYYDGFNRIVKPSGAVLGGCPPGSAPSIPVLDATQAAQVRRVGITLRTLEARPNIPPESYTLTSHVYLRNR